MRRRRRSPKTATDCAGWSICRRRGRIFGDILRYLAEATGDRAIARAFVDRLQQQCRRLASLPGTLGRARPELRPDIRSFPYRGYIIFFRYDIETFEVVNILERHRDFPRLFADD